MKNCKFVTHCNLTHLNQKKTFVCSVAATVTLVALFTALILTMHHFIKHRNDEPDSCYKFGDYRCYPRGDLCNFRTCSHEMWVVFFLSLSIICVLIAVAEDCGNQL